MDNFENEVRAMLHDKAGEMPDGFDADPALTARVRRRHMVKLTAATLAALVVVLGLGAGLANAVNSKKRTQVETTPTTTLSTVVGVGCFTSEKGVGPEPALDEPTRDVPGLDPTLAKQLASFGAPKTANAPEEQVLGPRDWHCQRNIDGPDSQTIDIVPNLGTPTDKQPAVSLVRSPLPAPGTVETMECTLAKALRHYAAGNREKPCWSFEATRVTDGLIRWSGDGGGGLESGAVLIEAGPVCGPRAHCAYIPQHWDLLTCRVGSPAGVCDGVIDDFVARHEGGAGPVSAAPTTTTSTSTTTTVATTTTTKPAGPSNVPGTGCAVTTANSTGSYPAPNVGPHTLPTSDAGVASNLGWYVSGHFTGENWSVLAPRGWACHVFEYGTGGPIVYVVPPASASALNDFNSSEQYTGALVRTLTNSLGTGSGVDQACEYLAPEPYYQSISQHWSRTCQPKAGRTYTKVADKTYSFVDTDGTHGVVTIQARPATDGGGFSVATCKLSGSLASLCDPILTDYQARNPASSS